MSALSSTLMSRRDMVRPASPSDDARRARATATCAGGPEHPPFSPGSRAPVA